MLAPGEFCGGSTGENPISSSGPQPSVRHIRISVGTLGITSPPFHAPVHLGVSAEGFGYICLGESGARSCLLGHCADGGR